MPVQKSVEADEAGLRMEPRRLTQCRISSGSSSWKLDTSAAYPIETLQGGLDEYQGAPADPKMWRAADAEPSDGNRTGTLARVN